jgi:hypothetical protein
VNSLLEGADAYSEMLKSHVRLLTCRTKLEKRIAVTMLIEIIAMAVAAIQCSHGTVIVSIAHKLIMPTAIARMQSLESARAHQCTPTGRLAPCLLQPIS